jgi:hypothetical protein
MMSASGVQEGSKRVEVNAMAQQFDIISVNVPTQEAVSLIRAAR